ncbi:uncharacterized protein LOC101460342 isoform X2 [Ceratitis capitata]|uniref:uncharacterized protein LOC101460342 isoform X2 n=1 Tax=Ceratitis capitata TaxID=7213 RepID=UPI000A0FA1BE|nr:uncharacterized protein LOC101460342 isoform X2 [Ceratitis capitata]
MNVLSKYFKQFSWKKYGTNIMNDSKYLFSKLKNMMNVFYMLFLIFCSTSKVLTTITINKIVVRIPKLNDIGLIFDLTVTNSPCTDKETLEFRIRSDGTCNVNVTEKETMKNVGRVVGGNFGFIESGAIDVVSLIWPTVSLFNRVGSCPIIVSSKNARGKEKRQKLSIHFDTRFTTLDPDGRTLRKRPDYRDCNNWDKEYLKNCTPVNCAERYFGQRNFYNKTTEHCEKVPRCDKPNMRYDFYYNDCLDVNNFFTAEDMKKIRRGDFVDECEQEEFGKAEQPINAKNNSCDTKAQTQQQKEECKKQQTPHGSTKRAADALDEEFNYFMHSKFINPNDDDDSEIVKEDIKTENDYIPYWLKGILEGLLVVFATVAIYILICFVIFLIVTWISRRQYKYNTNNTCILRSPAPSEGTEEPLLTPSSLLSQRR